MITRLTAQDASFHRQEQSSNPVYIGSLAIVEGPLDYDRLLDLVETRLAMVPRYRRKVRAIPLALGRPVWVEDSAFDLTYHIRRSALPAPGSAEQLHDLVARLASRPLDLDRPLWEMYLIEGLADGRAAVFTKTHAALVDGDSALEIGHVILDEGPDPRTLAPDSWHPPREPGDAELLAGALSHLAQQPREALEVAREAGAAAFTVLGAANRAVDSVVSAVRTATAGAPDSPLNARMTRNRRFDVVRTELADYRRIRARFGCSINDAILAVITGALREWLLSRDQAVTESATLRAIVPMSVYSDDPPGDTAGEVSSFLIDLPVGEPNPVMRLSHITHATAAAGGRRRGVRARTLVHLAGFAPASLHAMSVRAASTFAEHTFNLVITNAPGPQSPMYIGGARMLEMYPVSPLLRNQALSLGLTSYDGRVCYGLNADRDAMADLGVLAASVHESLEELLGACA
ncbi:WS/DGAT/MGAT family O-acyltransferase [Nocardia harenae]|uniref:WS/DGAT/MGAT family O-acyltransferase n=1 Tax=Nocardia harenae TaxID=358707 RepID=UPI00082AF229|nr:wax ester/triacylglycerol synthase family O-acyltransferase [Nocardia harenae]